MWRLKTQVILIIIKIIILSYIAEVHAPTTMGGATITTVSITTESYPATYIPILPALDSQGFYNYYTIHVLVVDVLYVRQLNPYMTSRTTCTWTASPMDRSSFEQLLCTWIRGRSSRTLWHHNQNWG